MHDQVAAKNIELGRIPSEDNEADLGTRCLERDRIKKCVTKMEMLFAGACAGEQLPVVSGTEVIMGEDLIGGQSWTMGVVLLVTVGVGPFGCACVVCGPHLPTGKCDEGTRGCNATELRDSENRERHRPRGREEVDSLMVFWRSVVAADDGEHA